MLPGCTRGVAGEVPKRPVGREGLMKTRREFLKQGLISGVTFALSGACRFGRDADGIDSGAIRKLGDSLEGQLILPENEAYDAARKFFWSNPATEKRPAIIARCERSDDIARCIEFSRKHDLVLAVRGGAHSFLGWSSCDDGLVIDVSPMKKSRSIVATAPCGPALVWLHRNWSRRPARTILSPFSDNARRSESQASRWEAGSAGFRVSTVLYATTCCRPS